MSPLDRASLKAFCSQPEDPAAPNGVEGRCWVASKSCLKSHATARAESASKLATRCLFATLNGLFGVGPVVLQLKDSVWAVPGSMWPFVSTEDAQRKLYLRIYWRCISPLHHAWRAFLWQDAPMAGACTRVIVSRCLYMALWRKSF
jgi:hypothetical protein